MINIETSIPWIDPSLFDWQRWRVGSPLEILALDCRYDSLTGPTGQKILKRYAVGYTDGQQVLCRPKLNTIAVMFFKDNHFWFHLRDKEFKIVFGMPDIVRCNEYI